MLELFSPYYDSFFPTAAAVSFAYSCWNYSIYFLKTALPCLLKFNLLPNVGGVQYINIIHLVLQYLLSFICLSLVLTRKKSGLGSARGSATHELPIQHRVVHNNNMSE
jgi:hypothetical protein